MKNIKPFTFLPVLVILMAISCKGNQQTASSKKIGDNQTGIVQPKKANIKKGEIRLRGIALKQLSKADGRIVFEFRVIEIEGKGATFSGYVPEKGEVMLLEYRSPKQKLPINTEIVVDALTFESSDGTANRAQLTRRIDD
ncbi:MAG: hypothetical protein AAFX87_09225 [Bacteroidota bacterium]